MKRLLYASVDVGLLLTVLALVGCPSASPPSASPPSAPPDEGGTITIASTSGTLTGSGTSWSFDAGTVPQYTTENVTFTVTNTSSVAFIATGALSFTNDDFTTTLSGSFTVQPGTSNTFVGSFTPTSPDQETGTLNLTPSEGSPIVIDLIGTPNQSFLVLDPSGSQIIDATSVITMTAGAETFSIENQGSSTITLTGTPFVTVTSVPGITISFQPNSPIPPLAVENFTVDGDWHFWGNTATVTINGTDSETGAPFTFSFQVYNDNQG